MNHFGTFIGLCMRYVGVAAVTSLLISIPDSGMASFLVGIAAMLISMFLMLPVIILFGSMQEKIWKLPYSDPALHALIGILIAIPGIIFVWIINTQKIGYVSYYAAPIMVGVVSVFLSRKSLSRSRSVYLNSHQI
ncbi:MAG: hypothetical protein ABW174_13570 [Flavitalea sp.]